MMDDPRHSRRGDESRALEARLRELPEVQPPRGLKDKLRAIPDDVSPARRHRRGWWVAACGAAAAAVLILTMLPHVPERPAIPPSAAVTKPTKARTQETLPHWIAAFPRNRFARETRPCDTLPPLPRWH